MPRLIHLQGFYSTKGSRRVDVEGKGVDTGCKILVFLLGPSQLGFSDATSWCVEFNNEHQTHGNGEMKYNQFTLSTKPRPSTSLSAVCSRHETLDGSQNTVRGQPGPSLGLRDGC